MSQAMAELFRQITTGVYVVGVSAEQQHNAFTAAWLMPVSFQPLLLAISVNPQHRSYRLIQSSKRLSVNVLRRDQLALAAHFGQPASVDKLANIAWHPGVSGVPLLDDVAAHFECEVCDCHPAGDHVLVVVKVTDGALHHSAEPPLTYRDTDNLDGAADIYPDQF